MQIWSGPDYGVTSEIGVVAEVAGEDFGRPGDSGSLVTMGGSGYELESTANELYCVGILTGLGRSRFHARVAIVTPLWAVLEEVELKLQQKIDFLTGSATDSSIIS